MLKKFNKWNAYIQAKNEIMEEQKNLPEEEKIDFLVGSILDPLSQKLNLKFGPFSEEKIFSLISKNIKI